MFDTNQPNSPCAFAEELVSYLYDENGNDGRAAMKAHLKTCAVCADELAGFGLVRTSISDWRAAEFSVLAKPQIEIPQAAAPVKIAAASVQTKSLLDKLRETFAFSTAWTTAATAAAALFVIVCAGLFALIHNFSGGGQVAEIENKNNLPTNISTTARNNSDLTVRDDANHNANQNTLEKSISPGVLKIKESPSPQNSQVASANESTRKVSNEPRPASKVKFHAPQTAAGARVVRKLENSNQETAQQAKAATTKASRAPKLNSIEDDEEDDDLLLLADLVDEAGKK